MAPWYEGNIALSFLEKGTSAYTGRLYSPFLYAREAAPYRVREDRPEGASRHILIEPDFPGILPAKIEGGAGFRYVKMNRSAYLPLWLASGACFAAGLLLFSDACRKGGTILAFLFSLFPLLMVSFSICASVAGLNLLILNQIGLFLWNGTILLMLLRVLVISGLVFFLATKSPSLRP